MFQKWNYNQGSKTSKYDLVLGFFLLILLIIPGISLAVSVDSVVGSEIGGIDTSAWYAIDKQSQKSRPSNPSLSVSLFASNVMPATYYNELGLITPTPESINNQNAQSSQRNPASVTLSISKSLWLFGIGLLGFVTLSRRVKL